MTTTTETLREACPRCDHVLATRADYEACHDECVCERCVSLCWSLYNTGCNHERVDWRARCRDAESRLRTLTTEAAAGTGLTHEELVQACVNIGYDLTCGACASVFFTGIGCASDSHTCPRAGGDPTCPNCGGHGVERVYAGHGNIAEEPCGTCLSDERVASTAEQMCRAWWGDDRAWEFFSAFDRERERWMRFARAVLSGTWRKP